MVHKTDKLKIDWEKFGLYSDFWKSKKGDELHVEFNEDLDKYEVWVGDKEGDWNTIELTKSYKKAYNEALKFMKENPKGWL